MSLYKTAFSAGDQHVIFFGEHIFALGHESSTHFFSFFQQSARVCTKNSVFSTRSARTVIFSLGAPPFSDFQQSTSVCPKQRFQPEITTYCHFCAGYTTFSLFSEKCTSLSKEQNSVISPRSARFIIFALCTPLISDFQQSSRDFFKCTSL